MSRRMGVGLTTSLLEGAGIRLDPTNYLTYFCRGCVYEVKGEKSKAEADFTESNRLKYAEESKGK